jgi:hypothetical protein
MLQKFKKRAYNLIVAVGSNKLKPFTHALALGFYFRVPTEGSSKRLFLCPLFVQPYSTRQQRICMDGLEENTDNRTHPLTCRPALVKRLVKDWVQRWNKAQSISELTRQAHLVAFVFS